MAAMLQLVKLFSRKKSAEEEFLSRQYKLNEEVARKRFIRDMDFSSARTKAFTGLYTKWDSFKPRKYKINLIRTLTYGCFRICSSPSLLQAAIKDLRKLLLQNGYPQGVITFNINDVLNKSKNKPNNSVQATVPKKDILIVLPYLGFHSNQVTKRLKSCVYNLYSQSDMPITAETDFAIAQFNGSALLKINLYNTT